MIETEHTPNPDTLKFLPGKKVSEIGPVEFLKSNKNKKEVKNDLWVISLNDLALIFIFLSIPFFLFLYKPKTMR